jgi:hypothetical protein
MSEMEHQGDPASPSRAREPSPSVSAVPASPAIAKILPSTLRIYRTHAERVAIRCALGDAAALCDYLAGQIAIANRGRGGKGAVTKRGAELEAIAKRCGDAIWQMRLGVDVPARGIDAEGQDPEGLGAEHESPTPQGARPESLA